VFDFVQLFGQRIAGLTQVHGALFEQFGGFAVVVMDGGEVFGFALGLAQGALQVVLAVAQLVSEFAAAREDLVGAGKQALAGGEFVKFALLGRDLFDFVELIGEQGEAFFVAGARVLPGFVLFFEVLPVAVGVSAGGEQFAVVGVAVKAAALFVVFQERLVVVLAVDAKKEADGSWHVYLAGGRKDSGRDLLDWVQEAVSLGAGEILLTSMDKDGTKSGFDLPMLETVSQVVSVPIIASGGAGSSQHILEVFEKTAATGALAASIFHYGQVSITETKKAMQSAGLEVRI